MDCPAILQETQKSIDFLASPLGDLPKRHQSIRAVLSQSWEMLPERLQAILAELTLFSSSFTLEAVLAIVPDVSLLDLATLLDRSLLQWRPNGRYSLHELLRQFATAQLAHALTPDTAVTQAHSRYYLEFVRQRETQLVGDSSAVAVGEIRLELDNILRGWQTAVTNQQWPLLQTSLEGLATYYTITGYLPEFETLLQESLQQVSAVTPMSAIYASLCEKLGSIYTHWAQYDKANQMAQQLFSFGQSQNQQAFMMAAHTIWGRVHHFQGKYDEALSLFETAVAYFSETAVPHRQAELYNFIGHVTYQQGQFDNALAQQQRALALSQQTANHLLQAKVFVDIGNIHTAQGRPKEALQSFQQALALNEALAYRHGISRNLHSMGRLYLQQDRDAEALACFQDSLAITEQLGLRRATSLCLNTIGIVYKRQMAFDTAVQYYQRALQINRELGLTDEIISNLGNLGNVYVQQARYDLAQNHLLEAVQLSERINYPEGLIGSLGNLASCYRAQAKYDQANQAYSRAIGLARQINARYFLAILLVQQADLLFDLDQQDEAATLAKEGKQVAQTVGNLELVTEAETLLQKLRDGGD
jgi:tetratricopeptide (TPR) repeat protein